MSKTILAIVPMDVQKWITITEYIKEKSAELTVEEQSAFDNLNNFWVNGNFDKTECEENIQILTNESFKHANNPNLKINLQNFRELCKKYYTKEEILFEEFQKKLGGKPNKSLEIPNPAIINENIEEKYVKEVYLKEYIHYNSKIPSSNLTKVKKIIKILIYITLFIYIIITWEFRSSEFALLVSIAAGVIIFFCEKLFR